MCSGRGGVRVRSRYWDVVLVLRSERMGLDPAFNQDLVGPERAIGVLVWSHGRSITVEDSEFADAAIISGSCATAGGMSCASIVRADGDTLTDSTRRLVDHVGQLKHKGYRRIVLAGQSFGAFLALMAADVSEDVDAVVATAPAAFGSFDEFYDSWRLNAMRLYPLLEQIKRARVMLFYFHGDDFDPGGRGEQSRAILSEPGSAYAVVDQPAFLVGHWASSTGLFLRRFGGCIRDFVDADTLKGELVCQPVWGEAPSAELRLPDELRPSADGVACSRRRGRQLRRPRLGCAYPCGGARPYAAPGTDFTRTGVRCFVAIEEMHGAELAAVYAIGPGIDKDEPAEWSRREGRLVDDDFIFEEKGKSTLRFHPRGDGGLSGHLDLAGRQDLDGSRFAADRPAAFLRRAEAR